jgi:formate dehydrogenase accessory protein FdhE
MASPRALGPGGHLWDGAIARAEALAATDTASAALLAFTAALLRVQRRIYTRVQTATVPHTAATGLSGDLATDLPVLRSSLSPLLDVVATHGPEPLARGASELRLVDPTVLDEMLIEYWRAPTDDQFFAKAMLQPYARSLADARIRPKATRDRIQPDQRCPFCGGMPQLAILRSTDPQGDGGQRSLQCATCLTVWPFRRILCANCGEEDERRLGYFHAADSPYPHVRVEVCASCNHYLKAIDLTTLGLAVPLVDEIAAAALDVWAREQGLTKIERNLVGL